MWYVICSIDPLTHQVTLHSAHALPGPALQGLCHEKDQWLQRHREPPAPTEPANASPPPAAPIPDRSWVTETSGTQPLLTLEVFEVIHHSKPGWIWSSEDTSRRLIRRFTVCELPHDCPVPPPPPPPPQPKEGDSDSSSSDEEEEDDEREIRRTRRDRTAPAQFRDKMDRVLREMTSSVLYPSPASGASSSE